MAQMMDMRPEGVQQHATDAIAHVKKLEEELERLDGAIDSLDHIWQSNEKTVVTTAAKTDIKDLRAMLASLITYGTTSLNIANRRIERENNFTNMLN